MMSSLVPGAIFYSPGFNKKSTPTAPNVTPSELDARYKKIDLDGKDWPADSPVSRAYDVRNTSTKLIILNNKYGKNSTRLRGYYSGPKKEERFVDPYRHRVRSPRNPDYHATCMDSSSPKFEPSVKTELEWVNNTFRPANSLAAKGSVNPRRHTSCQVSRATSAVSTERPHSHRCTLPPARYFSEFADLSVGEKLYLWSIEKIYNVNNMKQLKQEQYRKLLEIEAKKGYHGNRDYERYMRYINSGASRQYARTPSASSSGRAKSAVSTRSYNSKAASTKSDPQGPENENERPRPKTSVARTRQESHEDKDKGEKSADETQSTKSEEQKPKGPVQKSPSPSRKSSARSQRSVSARSQRSKSSSRASSAKSVRKENKSEEKTTEETTTGHKEGVDRPKSRLGHKSPEDRDGGPVHASQTSLKSGKLSIGSNGESDMKKPNPDTSVKNSNSSINNSSNRNNNNNMGSRTSIRSKGSTSGSGGRTENQGTTLNGSHGNEANGKKDVKVHRVPSVAYVKDESKEGNDRKEEERLAAENEQEKSKENQENSESSTAIRNQDKNPDTDSNKSKSVEELKLYQKSDGLDTNEKQAELNQNKDDESKSTPVNDVSDKGENVTAADGADKSGDDNQKMIRKDSFDDSDEDGDLSSRRNYKDPDKIEN